ncbi:MAG: arsenosugar biosynthesis radical SAM protein ArsS [Acidobacteria bacterium]|nr:arsenosugar biosynthesis radical SAM protein ArsS [Acidobacteriota bacterium]
MATLPQFLNLPGLPGAGGNSRHDFDFALRESGVAPLRRGKITTLQVNVGKLCNQACHHCHVEAGPRRTEVMTSETARRVLEMLSASPGVEVLDLTGGAPELNPNFATLVRESRRLGRHVIDRCNLTVLFEPGMEELAQFLVAHQVELVCSLPCYTTGNVDWQRGSGVFEKSVEALRLLNRLGYGQAGSPLILHLVYNPLGAFLPPPQGQLESKYREELRRLFGIEFHRLFTITNMPIKRFADYLRRRGEYEAYMSLLVNYFNPETLPHLMCRSLISVAWDGKLYDCDFNQMLEMGLTKARAVAPLTLWDVDALEELEGLPIATGSHCFGCAAGGGSSCGGALR